MALCHIGNHIAGSYIDTVCIFIEITKKLAIFYRCVKLQQEFWLGIILLYVKKQEEEDEEEDETEATFRQTMSALP